MERQGHSKERRSPQGCSGEEVVSARVHARGTATRSLSLDTCPWPPKPRVKRWSVLKLPAYHGLVSNMGGAAGLGPEVPSFRRFRGRKLFKEGHLK